MKDYTLARTLAFVQSKILDALCELGGEQLDAIEHLKDALPLLQDEIEMELRDEDHK